MLRMMHEMVVACENMVPAYLHDINDFALLWTWYNVYPH